MSTDGKRNAKPEGRRVSKSGNVYYESRPLHSDKVSTKAQKQLDALKSITKSKETIKKFTKKMDEALKLLAKKGKAR